MKNKLISVVLVLLLVFAFVSCDIPRKDTDEPVALSTPVVTISNSGLATWESIINAEFYTVLINNSIENNTTREVQLRLGDTISVKAVGDGVNFYDSPYSSPLTYTSSYTPHTHSWGEGIVTIEPDCDSEGVKTYTCSGCSETKKETISPTSLHIDANGDQRCDNCSGTMHAHVYSTTTVAPNCGNDGYKLHSCECGYSYKSDFVESTDEHTDNNGDNYCDGCQIYCIVELDFYAFNDLHGSIVDTDTQPGVDELTTYLKNQFADTEEYEIVLSSGDMWQGSVESSTNKGALMTEWMNEVGFVSMTLGNHEFDWGSEAIRKNQKIADFPFLAINIYDGGVKADYCQPSVIVERGGVKIGIIGAIGDCKSSISGEFNQDLTFITGSALTNLVKDEATRLRQEMGCDIIVYSIHDGDSNDEYHAYDESLSNGFVDVVFESHTHYSYSKIDSYGVPHVQAGGYNKGIGFVNLEFNLITGELVVDTARVMRNSEYSSSSLKDDYLITELYFKYFPDSDPYADVLGYNDTVRDSNEIGGKIAELYLEFGQNYWKDYDIVLAGGSLNTRPPYDLPVGDVTYADLYTLLPFDNDIVLGMVTGSTLKQRFANSSYYKIAFSEDYPSTINNSSMYYIIVDTYTAYYASNNITIVDRFSNYYSRDLLADYIKDGGWGQREDISDTTDIVDILASGVGIYKAAGTVVGVNNNSFILNDDTGIIHVFLGRRHVYKVGDRVYIEGTVGTYNGNYEFTQDTLVTVLGEGTYTQPTPTALSGADISALTAPFDVQYVTITGTLYIAQYTNSMFYNITIEGTTYEGTVASPTVSLDEYDGRNIKVTGYIINFSMGKYLNMVMTNIEVVE